MRLPPPKPRNIKRRVGDMVVERYEERNREQIRGGPINRDVGRVRGRMPEETQRVNGETERENERRREIDLKRGKNERMKCGRGRKRERKNRDGDERGEAVFSSVPSKWLCVFGPSTLIVTFAGCHLLGRPEGDEH